MRAKIFILLLLILIVNQSWASEVTLRNKCEIQINKKFSQWRMASVISEVAEWSKFKGQSPTEVYGDFDDNTYRDVAFLIQVGPNPKNSYPERLDTIYIAICLNKQNTLKLHLIDKPYCADFIYLSPKGQRYYNYDTGKTGHYPIDGVGAGCFEKAGATYIYDGAGFIQIVDSD